MAFKMNSPFKNLNRWFKEDWQTPSGDKDYSGGENLFRPKNKISKDTPKTWDEVSDKSKRKAQHDKDTTGRVEQF